MPDDAQSKAFRDASDADRVPDDELVMHAQAVHPPLTSVADIRLPDEHEHVGWDAGREGPKTLADARTALQARIDDPAAPDGPEVADAYHNGGE